MGIFSRFNSVVKANVDDLISRSEDPERMMNQAVREMAYQVVEIRKKVVVAVADERRFRAQWERELERAQSWKNKAKMAVRAGEDQLAKEALFRRREHEEYAEEYQKQWEAQRRGVDQLKAGLHALDAKIHEAKRKKGLLIAKKRRAEAQQAIQHTLSGLLEENNALVTLERLEERIEQMEAEADAAWEMNEQLTGDNLRQRFDVLEADHGVDMDLLELKNEMGLLPRASVRDEALLDEISREPALPARSEVQIEDGAYPIYVEADHGGRRAGVN